ncbi:protein Mis18-alpha [Astyanax mexicanus]|uniref:Protein Mis18-alpha n=1 Tax=Astyanax mexicanus TaxID=7994 RepID=A0A8T2L0X7_ASTMX|nr:protein Mis18-alpha [Astyanax mexicanus]KAG9263695.1 protein Mis18-alpha [Astyanax mexicanus]
MAGQLSALSDRADGTYVVGEDPPAPQSCGAGEEDGDGDAPAVFLCGKCRRPVGDSLSWAGSDEQLNQIMLKRVHDNIVIGNEPYVSSTRKEPGCLVVNLACRGCGSTLGIMYTSTPKELDFKRSYFCFGVENIESYVLGSADQQVAVVDSKDMPVTLELQEIVEQQMIKIKALAVTIGHRLMEIELDLQTKSES